MPCKGRNPPRDALDTTGQWSCSWVESSSPQRRRVHLQLSSGYVSEWESRTGQLTTVAVTLSRKRIQEICNPKGPHLSNRRERGTSSCPSQRFSLWALSLLLPTSQLRLLAPHSTSSVLPTRRLDWPALCLDTSVVSFRLPAGACRSRAAPCTETSSFQSRLTKVLVWVE